MGGLFYKVPVGGRRAPGKYTITCSGAQDPNYAITSNPGTLTITKAPTELAAPPASKGLLSIKFSATLTRPDIPAPIQGRRVAFSIQGHTICTAATNTSGVASCTVIGIVITLGQAGYTASYSGDAGYQASSSTGKL